MKDKRIQRLAHQIRDEISSYLQRGEVKDPRIGFASISHVKLSKDLQQAKVFVSVYGSPQEQQETIDALNRAKNFIRHLLIKNLYVRKVPTLTFVLDDSIAKSVELVHKINRLFEDSTPSNEENSGAGESFESEHHPEINESSPSNGSSQLTDNSDQNGSYEGGEESVSSGGSESSQGHPGAEEGADDKK